jgi:hypothetical protein
MKYVVIEQCAPLSIGIICSVAQFANLEILNLMCLPHIFHCAQWVLSAYYGEIFVTNSVTFTHILSRSRINLLAANQLLMTGKIKLTTNNNHQIFYKKLRY